MKLELFIKSCRTILDQQDILESKDEIQVYSVDRTRDYKGDASFVLFPRNSKQIQEVIKIANEYNVSLVPSGGRTGYSGGAVATDKEVIVSLSKMNRILNFNPEIPSVDVEAGVITRNLQNFVLEKKFFFPLDLASSGSSQIGGNIATNAGGIRVIRFGHIRNWVLGLEVVTGKGEILNFHGNLVKNNTGYDLKQLFIGSEGTLGIITQANLLLTAIPQETVVFLFAFRDFSDVLECLKVTRKKISDILAFECFDSYCLDLVCQKHQIPYPFKELKYQKLWYVLVEAEIRNQEVIPYEDYLNQIWEYNPVNATYSTSDSGKKSLFRFREDISEAISLNGKFHKNDISLPVFSLKQFIKEIIELVEKNYKDFKLFLFGHVGDGNIHINLLTDYTYPDDDFRNKIKEFDEKLYQLVHEYKGSISAEHGIGLLKKTYLQYSRSEEEISYMKSIKRIFDPNFILNRGKMFSFE